MYSSVKDIRIGQYANHKPNQTVMAGIENLLYDENFLSRLNALQDSNFLSMVPVLRQEIQFLKHDCKLIPARFENLSDTKTDELLDTINAELLSCSLLQSPVANFHFFRFVPETQQERDAAIRYALTMDPVKGGIVTIYVNGQESTGAIAEDLKELISPSSLSALRYFFAQRLSERVEKALRNDIALAEHQKQALERSIRDLKETEQKNTNTSRKVTTEIQNLVGELFSKYKSGVLNKRTRIQSKGTSVLPVSNIYSVTYSIDDEYLVVENHAEISDKLNQVLTASICIDSDERVLELNKNVKRTLSDLSRTHRIDYPLENIFERLTADIQTKKFLGDINYSFNFNEIEKNKKIRLQWPDIKSLLLGLIFTMIFILSTSAAPNQAADGTQHGFFGKLVDLYHRSPALFMMRMAFLAIALLTFFISFYSINKLYIKTFFRKGASGIRDYKNTLVSKQVESVIQRQMSDYISATNEVFNNCMDTIHARYKLVAQEITDIADGHFRIKQKTMEEQRVLSERNLSRVSSSIVHMQNKAAFLN